MEKLPDGVAPPTALWLDKPRFTQENAKSKRNEDSPVYVTQTATASSDIQTHTKREDLSGWRSTTSRYLIRLAKLQATWI